MQEYRGDRLLRTLMLDERETVAELSGEATHATIGKLPARGSIVKINGLEFVVKSLSVKQGTLNLEIRKPNKGE